MVTFSGYLQHFKDSWCDQTPSARQPGWGPEMVVAASDTPACQACQLARCCSPILPPFYALEGLCRAALPQPNLIVPACCPAACHHGNQSQRHETRGDAIAQARSAVLCAQEGAVRSVPACACCAICISLLDH